MFSVEEKLINSFVKNFSVKTELVEVDETLILRVDSYLKDKIIFSHDQDMSPFVEHLTKSVIKNL